jgi:hypothetical protein
MFAQPRHDRLLDLHLHQLDLAGAFEQRHEQSKRQILKRHDGSVVPQFPRARIDAKVRSGSTRS